MAHLRLLLAASASLIASFSCAAADRPAAGGRAVWHRPTFVSWSADPAFVIVLEAGPPESLALVDIRNARLAKRVAASDAGLVSAQRTSIAAADGSWFAMLDPSRNVVWLTRGAGPSPFASLTGMPTSEAVATKKAPVAIDVDVNPQALAASADAKTLLVACDSPGPPGRRICLVDVPTGRVSHRVIESSSNLRGLAVDPLGRFVLAAHLVPKSNLPSTQIEQGWVFTNALTILSASDPSVATTLPLDLRTKGFANPEGVAIAPDGKTAWVTHAGADLVSVVDLGAFQAAADTARKAQSAQNTVDARDLALPRKYIVARVPVGKNPRGVALSADGRWAVVANRLSDSLSVIDTVSRRVVREISLAEEARESKRDLAHDGEVLFHSGRLSFSGQFSCASCHPDNHVDGLNWDLPADGFNNFHNTKTLLGLEGTAPYGWLGSSATLRDRFTGTLRHLFQHEPTEETAAALEAYLVSLAWPERGSAAKSEIAPAIARGRALFEGKGACIDCHSGARFTDRAMHDIGTGTPGQAEFDTPSLVRIAETPPFLHDGRAATLSEVFEQHNNSGLHGGAGDLTDAELDDLVSYLESL